MKKKIAIALLTIILALLLIGGASIIHCIDCFGGYVNGTVPPYVKTEGMKTLRAERTQLFVATPTATH